MRNLLRSRRGSAAFATVIALVPLIGVVALGAEAGSWYVTRQHAQNAADAAAYSGALRLACTICWCDLRYSKRGLSRQAIRGTERVLQLRRHRLSRHQLCDQPSDRNLAGRADRLSATTMRARSQRRLQAPVTPFAPGSASNSRPTWRQCWV